MQLEYHKWRKDAMSKTLGHNPYLEYDIGSYIFKYDMTCYKFTTCMSNGLTFEIFNIFLRNFQDRYQIPTK